MFQNIESKGGPIPEGPVLVIANHQNALLDPLVVFHVAGRPTRPLAKAPLFDQLLLGAILRALGGLPVYRKQDSPSEMHRNEDTFRAAIDALLAGDALQIYPEGRSHSTPAVEPLRTGAARIALAAEAEADGVLGLVIVPIGLTWEEKDRFQGRVFADIGEPFAVQSWITPGGAEDVDAVRRLTDEMAERLRAVTLNLSDEDDLALIVAADRIYTRERRIHGAREREPLSARAPRLRRFARALEWLRTAEPETFASLSRRVRRVDAAARALGVQGGTVPRGYRSGAVMHYVLREGLALVMGLPLALVGSVIWYPAWVIPRWVVPRVAPEYESVATYKLATSLFTVPATLFLLGVGGYLTAGTIGLLVAVGGGVLSGLVALAWRRRWWRVREDVAVFFRVLRRPRLKDRLARERRELADEFDQVLARMEG